MLAPLGALPLLISCCPAVTHAHTHTQDTLVELLAALRADDRLAVAVACRYCSVKCMQSHLPTAAAVKRPSAQHQSKKSILIII